MKNFTPAYLFKTRLSESLWPAVPPQSNADLLAQLFQLEQTQWLNSQQIFDNQFKQLNVLIAYVQRHSSFYQSRFMLAGIKPNHLLSPEIFTQLPLLTRQELSEQAATINCSVIPQAHLPINETQTSGSTGQIVAVKRTALNGLMWMALTLRDHFWHRRDFSQTLAIIRANVPVQDNEQTAQREGWGPPAALLFKTGASFRQPLSLNINEQVNWLLRRNPHYLLTYPTNLDALLDAFEARERFPPGLTEIRIIGETFSTALKARCDKHNLKTVDVYSAQEVGVIALQCPESGLYHIQAESLLVEIINDNGEPCKPDEIGRVVITDLHNFATPLIRYEIRDYAQVGEPCPCGRGLHTLKKIMGRRRNMVTLPNGEKHWPTVGFHEFRNIAPIRQYQAIQHDVANVEIKLVIGEAISIEQEQRLTAIIQAALGYPFKLTFSYFNEELPKSRGGKFEEFISLI
jgi:phenylacetate-CoA ligase